MENGQIKVDAVLKEIPSISARLGVEPYSLFLHELLGRNKALGLMSKQSPVLIAAKLTELSVNLWDFLQETFNLPEKPAGIRIIDIGTGNGFPGVIWKLLRPDLELVLLERKKRRVDYLHRLILLQQFENMEAVEGDVREIAHRGAFEGTFDIAVMLAVASLEVLASPVEKLLKPDGVFSSTKSRGMKVIPAALGENLQLESTTMRDKSTLIAYRKVL